MGLVLPRVTLRENQQSGQFEVQTDMEVTVKLDGKKMQAKVCFAKQEDFSFAEGWVKSIGDDQNPIRTDTVEYAQLAVKKYEAAFGTDIYAKTLQDFDDHILSNPKVEVGGFVVLRCDWYPGAKIIGFAHFRRTWSNKIVLDYLGTHPLIARPFNENEAKVGGVGVALLYFIGQLLKRQNCQTLWGEATSLSASYYQKVFGLEGVEDLIVAPRENVIRFLEECERDWSAESDDMAAASDLLAQAYALESENPPFVGSKMVVFNQSKRLAYRYLKLPYHRQVEIAKALDFVKDAAIPLIKEELARIVFKQAREKGRLAELWDLVEAGHNDGSSEENPFKGTTA